MPYIRIVYIGDILHILRPYLAISESAQFPDVSTLEQGHK
jgi:hypothetical protein